MIISRALARAKAGQFVQVACQVRQTSLSLSFLLILYLSDGRAITMSHIPRSF